MLMDLKDNCYVPIIQNGDNREKVIAEILKKFYSVSKSRRGKLLADTKKQNSHLRKLEQGEGSKTYFDTAAAFMGKILNASEFSLFVEKFYPEIDGVLTQSFKVKNDLEPITSDNLNQELKDVVSSTIYQIATTNIGVDSQKASNQFGLKGEKKLITLLKLSQSLREINNRIKITGEEPRIMDILTVLNLIKNNLSLIEPEHLRTDLARISTTRESVNITALRQIHQMLFKFITAVYDVAVKEENRGDIPFSLNAFCQVLDPNQLEKS